MKVKLGNTARTNQQDPESMSSKEKGVCQQLPTKIL